MPAPLPTPAPAPRRPPVPAGFLRVIAVASVIGLAVLLKRGAAPVGFPLEGLIISRDAIFPSPLVRAATPISDGFQILGQDSAELAIAAATGLVVVADSVTGSVVIFHRLRVEQGDSYRYFFTHYDGLEGLYIAVDDPVARGQKIAETISGRVMVWEVSSDRSEKSRVFLDDFLRKYPRFASPGYALPPFPPYGGGELPVTSFSSNPESS